MFGIAQIDEVIKELDLGLNDERLKLVNLLMSDEPIRRIVVENKDRLACSGFNYLEILANKQNFEIVVVNKAENDKEELTNESNRNSSD